MNEIWKEVPGYDGRYQVSNLGNVRSRGKTWKNSYWREITPINKTGRYLKVRFYKKAGEWDNYPVHRVVAMLFIPNPDCKPEVNHINGNKRDNYVSNLEWCTRKENSDHAWRSGLMEKSRQKARENVSPPLIQLSLDGKVVKVWRSLKELNKKLGYCKGTVSQVCTGKQETAYGYKWKYYNKE